MSKLSYLSIARWCAFALVLIQIQSALAQTPILTHYGPGLDRMSEPVRKTNAVVSVELDGALGTGVIICVDENSPVGKGFSGFCLTAEHVVADDNGRRAIRVTYDDGRVASRCKVVASDPENDVALLWVWVPEGIEPATLAKKPLRRNEKVYFAGLGGGADVRCCIRNFDGVAAPPTTSEKIFASVSLLPGDSGGPVFNQSGEVVGVISGGWLWFATESTIQTNGLKATWPARACNVGAVRKVITDAVICVKDAHGATGDDVELASANSP